MYIKIVIMTENPRRYYCYMSVVSTICSCHVASLFDVDDGSRNCCHVSMIVDPFPRFPMSLDQCQK